LTATSHGCSRPTFLRPTPSPVSQMLFILNFQNFQTQTSVLKNAKLHNTMFRLTVLQSSNVHEQLACSLAYERCTGYSSFSRRERICLQWCHLSFSKHGFVFLCQYIIYVPFHASFDMHFHTMYAISHTKLWAAIQFCIL